MTTADDQRANVAAFAALPEQLPGLSMDEWRKLVAPWKARMGLMITVGDLRALLDEHEALLARVAKLDVCEACGDCLEPVAPRCERHVHTEPGDEEWTIDDEEDEAPEHCVLCSRQLSQREAAQAAGACAGCVAQELGE